MDCPKCSVGKLNEITVRANDLYRAKALQGESVTMELKLEQCFVCNGVWFDAGELKKYLAEDVTIVNSPVADRVMLKEADQKVSQCPRCHVAMKKQRASEDPNVTIDVCERCQGIWLDSGELDRLELKDLSHTKRFGVELEHFFNVLFRRNTDD